MTTDNRIILQNVEDAITIPREYLFGANGESFVFMKKDGAVWKKKVIRGFENDSEVLIKSGLSEKDKIFTSVPDNANEIDFYEG